MLSSIMISTGLSTLPRKVDYLLVRPVDGILNSTLPPLLGFWSFIDLFVLTAVEMTDLIPFFGKIADPSFYDFCSNISRKFFLRTSKSASSPSLS